MHLEMFCSRFTCARILFFFDTRLLVAVVAPPPAAAPPPPPSPTTPTIPPADEPTPPTPNPTGKSFAWPCDDGTGEDNVATEAVTEDGTDTSARSTASPRLADVVRGLAAGFRILLSLASLFLDAPPPPAAAEAPDDDATELRLRETAAGFLAGAGCTGPDDLSMAPWPTEFTAGEVWIDSKS